MSPDKPTDPFANFPGGNPFGPNGPFGGTNPFAGGDPFRQMDEWMKSMGMDPGDFRRIFDEMQRGLQDAMKNMGDDPSKGFMAGFNVRMGPDGKPSISSFGNKPRVNVAGEGPIVSADQREPLTDLIEEPTSIAITMELPGVEKKDVDIRMTADRLEVHVDTEARRYNKAVRLPAKVDPKTTRATYNNGVLDVTVQKVQADDEALRINLD
jgi:HSP20 family protein